MKEKKKKERHTHDKKQRKKGGGGMIWKVVDNSEVLVLNHRSIVLWAVLEVFYSNWTTFSNWKLELESEIQINRSKHSEQHKPQTQAIVGKESIVQN